MRGFQPGKHKAAQKNYAGGGMVRGPGTGTSDDIPAKVKTGSYVMPADTTKAVGFKPGMRDVHLSNGENVVAPEQVVAIGAAVLDLVKGATHTPAAMQENEPGEGPAHEGAESPMYEMAEDAEEKDQTRGFFADGGLVDEEKKRNSFGDAAASAASQSVTQVPTGQPRPGASAADQIPGSAPPGWTGGTGDKVTGTDFTRNVSNTVNALAPIAGAFAPAVAGALSGASRGASVMAPALEKVAAYGVPAAGYGALASANQPAQPEIARPGAATSTPAVTQPAQPGTPAAQTAAQATTPAQPQAQGFMPNVYQHGRGQYSDNADGMGFAAGFTGKPGAQNDAAAEALANNSMRGFKPAGAEATAPAASQNLTPPDHGQGYGFGLLNSNRIELRNAAIGVKQGERGAERAYDVLAGQQGVGVNQALAQKKLDAETLAGNRDRALRAEDMQQTRGFRAGQLANDQARTALDARRVNSDVEARGFEVGQARRLENLRAKYESATDPKAKADLAQQLNTLSGKGGQSDWAVQVTPATKNVDGSTSQGSIIKYNKATGEVQRVGDDQGAQAAEPPQPAVADLLANPGLASQFDAKYGPGAAAKILAAQRRQTGR